MSEGDSSCHGCQTARPAAYQTAGYSVTADMLNRPLKRNRRQPYRCLTVTHQRASNTANWTLGESKEKFDIYRGTIEFLPSITKISAMSDHMQCCEIFVWRRHCLEANAMWRVLS